MSLFGNLSGLFTEFQSLQSNQLAGPLMNELSQHGIDGVDGLVDRFAQTGFGEHVASWIGNGQNLPLDQDSIQRVLGQPVLQGLADKYGLDTSQVSAMLAQHLPGIIDHLTPGGQTPNGQTAADVQG
ncbi:YidB family protein [Acidocella facilis]|uniref:YidB family protein n=1 Tax=Acidocella facilis TaxID=525 RepID=UPI001F47EB56|nr:YidB family protein [Acidocella facilis]